MGTYRGRLKRVFISHAAYKFCSITYLFTNTVYSISIIIVRGLMMLIIKLLRTNKCRALAKQIKRYKDQCWSATAGLHLAESILLFKQAAVIPMTDHIANRSAG